MRAVCYCHCLTTFKSSLLTAPGLSGHLHAVIFVVLPLEGFISSLSPHNQGAMVGKEAANHQRS